PQRQGLHRPGARGRRGPTLRRRRLTRDVSTTRPSPAASRRVPAPATVADFSDPEPDILGEPYVSCTVPLSLTDGGHAPGVRDVATVVSRPDAGGRRRAIVYL